MKKLMSIVMCLALVISLAGTSLIESQAAADWPEGPAVTAEGACLIDASTGAILYGKNMDTPYFPASITKIMTALLVIENCTLDEIVTFSKNAVFNVEKDSSSLGMDVGDQLSVEDCLYGLLLKSANEVGNALAEHVSGSIEAFAELMNQRAKELGCTNTNFANPHGLNNPEHTVSAKDMALIAAAAFSNETFVRIDSTRSYKIPPTKRNPDGIYVSCGHRMLKKNDSMYYPGIIGGKTGYTSLAGNTLVTCVERNGLKLVAVVLKNTNPSHYEDTRNLLDFGFSNFQSVNVSQNDTSYSFIGSDFTFNGLSATDSQPPIELNKSSMITLPIGASFADTTSELNYDIPKGHESGAIARITYTYSDRVVGQATLDFTAPARQSFQFARSFEGTEEETTETAGTNRAGASGSNATDAQNPDTNAPGLLIRILGIFAIVFLAGAGGFFLYRCYGDRKRKLRWSRRMSRLSDLPPSSTLEFDSMLKERMKKSRRKRPFWQKK